jgi:hypothetical protein
VSTPTVWPDSPRVRVTDPVTSHEAADATTSVVAASQAAVAHILTDAGKSLTHEEIIQRGRWQYGYRFSDSRFRTATKELVDMGRVVNDGITRLEGHRIRQTLWKLAAG